MITWYTLKKFNDSFNGDIIMRFSNFPYISAWREMIREMERIGVDLDSFSTCVEDPDRIIYPFVQYTKHQQKNKKVFRHEIQNFPDEIILVIEINDCIKESITIYLIDNNAIEIRCTLRNAEERVVEDQVMRGQWVDKFQHIFPLPDEVTTRGSTLTFRHGILEVRLKKKPRQIRKIVFE